MTKIYLYTANYNIIKKCLLLTNFLKKDIINKVFALKTEMGTSDL